MSTFSTALTPTPAKDKGIPYTWFTKLLDNTLALKQGDVLVDYLGVGQDSTLTTTGTLNNHNPAKMDIPWSGSSQLVITGSVPKGTGDIRIYRNVSASQPLAFQHENTGSTAANRFQLPAAYQFIGPNGAAVFKYGAAISRWIMIACTPGKMLDLAYNAPNYGAVGGGTWTFPSGAGNLTTFGYSQTGTMIDVDFYAQNTTVTGTVNNLTIALPGGSAARSQVSMLCDCRSNGSYVPGLLFITAGATSLSVFRQDRVAWTPGTANTDVSFTARINLA